MNTNEYPGCVGYIFILAILTIIIPLMQWLASKYIAPSGYGALVGNVIIIVLLSYWCLREELFSYRPSSPLGKAFSLFVGISVLILLVHNLQDRPVSRITGQAKLPHEVVDVTVLGSIAEEIVFRGAMWSIFKQLSGKGKEQIIALLGTSVLFGVSHIGYWVQSSWPLPPGAYVHVISMVLAGLFFGVFRLKTRSLTVPISFHMLANGVILLAQ